MCLLHISIPRDDDNNVKPLRSPQKLLTMNCRNADGEKTISVDKFSEYFDDSERTRFAAEFNVFSIRDIPERSWKNCTFTTPRLSLKIDFLDSMKFNELWSEGELRFCSIFVRFGVGIRVTRIRYLLLSWFVKEQGRNYVKGFSWTVLHSCHVLGRLRFLKFVLSVRTRVVFNEWFKIISAWSFALKKHIGLKVLS